MTVEYDPMPTIQAPFIGPDGIDVDHIPIWDVPIWKKEWKFDQDGNEIEPPIVRPIDFERIDAVMRAIDGSAHNWMALDEAMFADNSPRSIRADMRVFLREALAILLAA